MSSSSSSSSTSSVLHDPLKLSLLIVGSVSAGIVVGSIATRLVNKLLFADTTPTPASTASTSLASSAPASVVSTRNRANTAAYNCSSPASLPCVVIVDPVSTGANVAHEILSRGYPCIRVMSGYINPFLMTLIDAQLRTDFLLSLQHDSADPVSTLTKLRALPVQIIGVVSGSELGIELTDYISENLGIASNGTALSQCRRDKYQMGECIRRHGIRAVKQCRVSKWCEIEQFLVELKPQTYPVVLKPIKSAGSDQVYKCENYEETRQRFNEILGNKNQLGAVNEAVVIQEFLEGIEYVVDSVSRNGVHKVVALWEYDKRRHAGHDFVYFGMGSLSGTSSIGRQLASYVTQCLTALDIKHGAGHSEVILTKTGPCLVETGARCHGCEGTFMPLADRCWGYNQVTALVDATVSEEAFNRLPDVCGEEIEYGFKVDFVSYVAGKLSRLNHVDAMRALPSFVQFDLLPKPGETIHVTIDCFTAVGSVTLAHKSRAVVEQDHAKIREWEKTMFVVE